MRVDPRDADRLGELGLAYQLRWRETGDPSFLPLSERALRRALRRAPRDAAATLGLGNLALIRHDFRGALALGREARRSAPFAARPYGVVGDALIELGRYPAGLRGVRPDGRPSSRASPSYARIAYARELTGDRRGAVAAMQLALDAAGGVPEPTAWAHVELAKLALGDGPGRRSRASTCARRSRSSPDTFSRSSRRRGSTPRGAGSAAAVAAARRAATAVPLPQFVALLGDLLERQGRTAAAARAASDRRGHRPGARRERAARRPRDARSSGPTTASGRRKRSRLARRARADRPSIYGDDALGWALARAGRCAEAEPWLDRALRLGTKDALLYFHRGYAAGCAGDRRAMRAWYRRALAQSPAFSVRWAPVARKALA